MCTVFARILLMQNPYLFLLIYGYDFDLGVWGLGFSADTG